LLFSLFDPIPRGSIDAAAASSSADPSNHG